VEITIEFVDYDEAQAILGIRDLNLRMIRDGFDIEASSRGLALDFQGMEAGVCAARDAVERMRAAQKNPGASSPEDELEGAIRNFREGSSGGRATAAKDATQDLFGEEDGEGWRDLAKIARTEGQARYLRAMAKNSAFITSSSTHNSTLPCRCNCEGSLRSYP
jgi:phosphate starvation-inducible protein PhoH